MAFDGAYLHAVQQEIEPFLGARVEKIHQPSRDELILHLRSFQGAVRILISIAGDSARIHLTEIGIENPASPPMFCMLLRKHLGGGKFVAVRQDGDVVRNLLHSLPHQGAVILNSLSQPPQKVRHPVLVVCQRTFVRHREVQDGLD